jgi:peptidyl-dipeptidase Dcp
MNPLLEKFNTPFDTPPFHLIKPEHFLSAIQEAIALAKNEIASIKASALPDFENTVAALDCAGGRLNVISAIFFNLNSAETNDEIQALAREISPLLTAHSNDILLDEELFDRIKQVYAQKDQLNLSEEQETLLDKTYKAFVRNGAQLNENQKNRLRDIDKELSQLRLQFGENVLAETNKYELVLENESV